LCLLFAAFISMFALDVFGESGGFWHTVLALLIHLIPTAILLAVLALSWRWEWVGAVAFSALGIYYLVSAWGRFPWSTLVLIAGPLLVLGILFALGWRQRKHCAAPKMAAS
jgi:hypothetical protein